MPLWRLHWPSLKEVAILAATVLYYTGDEVISKTALPYFTYGVCHDLSPNTTVDLCLHLNQHPEKALDVQEDSVLFVMAEKMFSNIPPLLMTALCGTWSDSHGRKLPLLLAYLGNILAVVLFLLALKLHHVPVVSLLVAGFLVKSFVSQNILFNLMVSSCLADLVWNSGCYEEIGAEERDGEERHGLLGHRSDGGESEMSEEAFRMGKRLLACMCRMQVAEAVGKVLGSFLGWLCQLGGGAVLALLVGAGICLTGMLVVLCWVKDYRNLTFQTGAAVDDTNSLKTCLKKLGEVFSFKKLGMDPVVVWGCFCITLFTVCCRTGRTTVVVPYIQQPPLSWPRDRFSAYVACCSAFQSIFLFLIAPLMWPHTVVIVSLLFTTAGGIWMAFSNSTWSMFMAGCFSYMIDCVFPAVKSILCSRLNQNQVGQILSKISLAVALSGLIGPPAFASVYIYTKDYFAGLAFLVSSALPAAILLAAAMIEVFYTAKIKPSQPELVVPPLEPRDASLRPDYTQSMDILTPVMANKDVTIRSAQW